MRRRAGEEDGFYTSVNSKQTEETVEVIIVRGHQCAAPTCQTVSWPKK